MIDTETLRKKVIDLAIQGKLTQQLPEDGNAEELYAQIQKEKTKLFKEGKIKKEKPLNVISDDEIPFDIPSNWKWTRIGDVSVLDGTGLIRSGNEQHTNGEYYYFKMNNIGNFTGVCDFADMPMIDATDEEYSKFRLREGDFLFNTRNSVELVGKCTVVHRLPNDNVLFNNNILRINFCCGINADYVKYYCLSSAGRNKLKQFVSSTTNVAAIYQRQIVSLIIPLPPVSEQKRITQMIDVILSQIDIVDDLQKQFEADREILKRKIIDAGICGKLSEHLTEDGNAEDLCAQIQTEKAKLIKEGKIKKEKPLSEISDDEIPFDIPNNWKWVRLGDVCFQITDGTHKTPTYLDKGIPFLSVKNISSGRIDLDDIKFISREEHETLIKRCNPEKDNILVCRIGTLGKAIVIDTDLEFSVFVSLGLIKTLNRTISDYIVNVINSGYGAHWINENKAGGAMHTYKINLGTLSLMPIPFPPLLEQSRILEIIRTLLLIGEV